MSRDKLPTRVNIRNPKCSHAIVFAKMACRALYYGLGIATETLLSRSQPNLRVAVLRTSLCD